MSALPDLADRTLGAAFERVLATAPDHVALETDGLRLTFGEMHERALLIAGGLAGVGLTRGDRVLTMIDSSVDAVGIWFGCAMTGIVEVPVNVAFRGAFLAQIANDSGATVMVVDAAYVDRVLQVADQLEHVRHLVVRGDHPGGTATWVRHSFEEVLTARPAVPVALGPHDVAALMFTSGTTGRSKGVRCTQAQLYTYSSWEDVGLPTSEERSLVVLPLFHFAGRGLGIYRSLIHGATAVLEPRFSASRFWETTRRLRTTNAVIMGTMAEMLAKQPARPDDADHPMRWMHVGPLPEHFENFERRFGVSLATGYGMTEIGLVASSAPGACVAGGTGTVRAGFEVMIADEMDRPVAPGAIGELLVRSAQPWLLADGYHERPAETAEARRNLWFHTGDAFSMSDDGELFFRDRLKDSIRWRGENVSSVEVESTIMQHPDVALAAVVSVPSELLEDEIKAVIVARQDCTIDPVELVRHLADALPYFMVPRYYEFVDELPTTPTSKVLKHQLRADGLTPQTWDRASVGITTRGGHFHFPETVPPGGRS